MRFFSQCFSFFFLFFLFSSIVNAEVNFEKLKFRKSSFKLSSSFLKTVADSEKYTWIGTSAGLNRISKETKNIRTFLKNKYITSIIVDENAIIWVGFLGGIAKLDNITGRIITYDVKNSGLKDKKVNDLLLQDKVLYVGHRFGVDTYNTVTEEWKLYTALDGLPGASIESLDTDGQYIWSAGEGGIAYFEEQEGFWISYGADVGLLNTFVTDLAVDGDVIWLGTSGGGLFKFSRIYQRFIVYASDTFGLIDDNIQFLLNDGKYLWVGTFSGLSVFDKSDETFLNFAKKSGFKELSLFCAGVSGSQIFVGTDGAGLLYAKKEHPTIKFNNFLSGYDKSDTSKYSFYVDLFSETAIKKVSIDYSLFGSNTVSFSSVGVSIAKEIPKSGKGVFVGVLVDKELESGLYNVRINVLNTKGGVNTLFTTMLIDNIPPQVNLRLSQQSGDLTKVLLSGRYLEDNFKKIEVYFDGKLIPSSRVALRKLVRQFVVSFSSGTYKKVKVRLFDIGNNITEIEKNLELDRTPPKIRVEPVTNASLKEDVLHIRGEIIEKNLDIDGGVIINPGGYTVSLASTELGKFTFEALLPYTKVSSYKSLQIIAVDTFGLQSVKKIPISVRTKNPLLIFSRKPPGLTLKKEIALKGYLIGPKPDKFTLTLFGTKNRKVIIPIDNKAKFSTNLLLELGVNTYEIEIQYKKTNYLHKESFVTEYSDKKVDVTLPSLIAYSKNRSFNVKGTLTEGVKSIFVNGNRAVLDFKDGNFQLPILLKKGKNKILIKTLDDIDRTSTQNMIVHLDEEKPRVKLYKVVPASVFTSDIVLAGVITEDYPSIFSVQSNAMVEVFNENTGEFRVRYKLHLGNNQLSLNVVDRVENFVTKLYSVRRLIKGEQSFVTDPNLLARVNNLEQENQDLKDELDRINKQLQEARRVSGTSSNTGLSFSKELPRTSGLFYKSFIGSVKSYELAAEIYLGSSEWSSRILQFNGVDPNTLEKVLIPTPELYALLRKVRSSSKVFSIMQYIGKTFVQNQNRDQKYIQKTVIDYLFRQGILEDLKYWKGYAILFLRDSTVLAFAPNTKKTQLALKKFKSEAGVKEMLISSIQSRGVIFSKI